MAEDRALIRVKLLQDLPMRDLAALSALCAWRSYDRGQEVISQDSGNHDVFFVINGRVRVTIFALSGREVSFRDLAPGASFGELSAIDGQRRSASVVGLTPAVLASLSR